MLLIPYIIRSYRIPAKNPSGILGSPIPAGFLFILKKPQNDPIPQKQAKEGPK
jgi:hypothetical protein